MLLPHRRVEELERDLPQVVLLGADVVEHDAALFVQFVLGEGGVEEAIRHQVETTFEVAGEKLRLQAQAIASGVPGEGAGHTLDLVHDLLCATGLGATDEQGGKHARYAARAVVLVAQPAYPSRAQGDDRH